MRPGAKRIETKGSFVFLDEDAMEYMRLPKSEGPRQSPPGEDWGGPNADPGLQDMVWHSFTKWEIRNVGFWEKLVIWLDDEEHVTTYPIRFLDDVYDDAVLSYDWQR